MDEQDKPSGDQEGRVQSNVTRREVLSTAGVAGASVSFTKTAFAQKSEAGAKLTSEVKIKPYEGPAGGWGSVQSVATHLSREGVPMTGSTTLWNQNKPGGFMCVSCAWAKPKDHHPFEFCENGAKATAWEITSERIKPEFFARHTCKELEAWTDFDLEKQGRITDPLRWDATSDKYVKVSWADAFRDIGERLKSFNPKETVFYTSGRAALETSYMFQLFARMYGHNNLPDSSNMCHESTSVGLPESIGVSVGTGTLEDFKHCDLIIHIGQNPGTNSPRILHEFQTVRKRGVGFIVFNPMRERGLERFTNPQSPVEMLTLSETTIATQYNLIKVGGDIPALTGVCKAVIALDDAARDAGRARVIDVSFIEQHTHGFEEFANYCRNTTWEMIEQGSGLGRTQIEQAANTYAKSKACLGIYGMGVTQQIKGTQNVHMICNLLLLRGNIGKPGGNVIPVRGHSNVQGQRTVGITEKPELAPLDKLEVQYVFKAPRDKGMNTIEAAQAVLDGKLKAFIALGGNFVRALPDFPEVEAAWRKIPLTVQIATKLNRNHIIHGEVSYILPCLGRSEIDRQASGEQAVSMEDSTAHFHGSKGQVEPASANLLSEPKIVAELAKATLGQNGNVPWDAWVGNYGKIRDEMEKTWDVMFKDYNKRLFTPGGFARPVAARKRQWHTPSGRANFLIPESATPDTPSRMQDGGDILRLTTVRSNDQFNTTVYGYSDRFRGVEGTRMVVFMNDRDIRRLGFKDGQFVNLTTAATDESVREVKGFRVVRYAISEGCAAAYFPEASPLVPLWHYEPKSHTPAYKFIPVKVTAAI
ncbi:MAG: FdhF/YdeP family oxidoreductase [Hyphomicrobiales bacterium]|nr:FdhF/YdeP family oxidoreductase [Hyphomicrobiales bacterium]